MRTHSRPLRCRQTERGFALLETLIAALVVAASVLALIWLQGALRYNADIARQRTEAARIAQAEIERLRSFAAVDAAPGRLSWGDITDEVLDATPSASPTTYLLTRVVQTDDRLMLKTVQVRLSWNDRRGQPQQFSLETQIVGHDPALAGTMTLPRIAFARP
ncbi:MAG: hypothetical protein M9915_12095 [Rhizobacter sp.]|nr:hypothetical protein [Rhizobacter sp.]